NVGAVGVAVILRPGKLDLCAQVSLLFKKRLKIAHRLVQRAVMKSFSRANRSSAQTRNRRLQLVLQLRLLLIRRPLELHPTEFRSLTERNMKYDIGDRMRGVGLYIRLNLSLEVAFLLKKSQESLRVLVHFCSAVGRLDGVVGNLD